jgi:hypothetical protein
MFGEDGFEEFSTLCFGDFVGVEEVGELGASDDSFDAKLDGPPIVQCSAFLDQGFDSKFEGFKRRIWGGLVLCWRLFQMSRTSAGGAKSATSTMETREPPARMVMSILFERLRQRVQPFFGQKG